MFYGPRIWYRLYAGVLPIFLLRGNFCETPKSGDKTVQKSRGDTKLPDQFHKNEIDVEVESLSELGNNHERLLPF